MYRKVHHPLACITGYQCIQGLVWQTTNAVGLWQWQHENLTVTVLTIPWRCCHSQTALIYRVHVQWPCASSPPDVTRGPCLILLQSYKHTFGHLRSLAAQYGALQALQPRSCGAQNALFPRLLWHLGPTKTALSGMHYCNNALQTRNICIYGTAIIKAATTVLRGVAQNCCHSKTVRLSRVQCARLACRRHLVLI